MKEVIMFASLAVGLFVASFIAKRRFGLLGLALAAGSLLSGIWGYDAGLLAGVFGVPANQTTSAIVAAIIVVLPAVVLLFHGNVYKTLIGRTVGAFLFTTLALAFLLEPLGSVLIASGIGQEYYGWVVDNRMAIVGAGMVLAVIDLFLTKPTSSKDRRSRH